MSKMWERELSQLSNKIETLEKHRSALQDSFDRMLSPPSDFQVRLDLTNKALLEARGRYEATAAQNRLQDIEEERRRKLPPLQPARDRSSEFYRTQLRNAAILGILERERRRNAPLSREAWSRAQSIDARSRRSLYGSQVFSYKPNVYDYENKVDPATGEVLDWMDPCVEWRTQQKMRRAAMAAAGLLGKGYKTRKRPNPCV